MVKRNVEIDDTLDEIIESARDDVKTEIKNYIEENKEKPDYSDLDYNGALNEIFDGAVPIYTSEINDLFYLYGNEFEEALDNAGIGDKDDEHWPMGWKPAAIYCYIEQEIGNDLDEMIDELWDEWKEKQPKEEKEE
jgi:hypothetical protein